MFYLHNILQNHDQNHLIDDKNMTVSLSRGCLGYQHEDLIGCTKKQSGEINCNCDTDKCNGAIEKRISTFLMILLFFTMRM